MPAIGSDAELHKTMVSAHKAVATTASFRIEWDAQDSIYICRMDGFSWVTGYGNTRLEALQMCQNNLLAALAA